MQCFETYGISKIIEKVKNYPFVQHPACWEDEWNIRDHEYHGSPINQCAGNVVVSKMGKT